MYREKLIIYTAHCVLNQNAVINGWERAQGAFNDIIRILLDYNISIVQMPCPEFTFLGEDRPPKTKEEYDTPEYRQLCKELALRLVEQIVEYKKHDYKIIGLLGIGQSPSCDTMGKKGIFMEELFMLIEKEDLQLPTFDIPENYKEGEADEVVKQFKNFIEEKLHL
ncbi:hypothetical protein KQI88_02195 [Alkaliphilus sp. MSJ-5]|uniref:DUF523 domain-containing protein n=1 Tax=Alkaliphilus flagellatus TaxID=2841507 RepID=A0ABS6G0J5_9FIRM|nr:CD3072 family TudS-related putative desulfidase [Alkaliphilus flagellatus]MBU5675227.1 hypothetical protein [Alkaliphilus flagellatus]